MDKRLFMETMRASQAKFSVTEPPDRSLRHSPDSTSRAGAKMQ